MLKAEDISGNILFEEKQKFPVWLNILVTGIILLTIIIALVAGFTGSEEERDDMWLGLVVAVPIEILIIVLFQYVQLEKSVTSNGLYYRWKPWHRRFRVIEKEDIESFSSRKFPFLSYGFGWIPTYGWYHHASNGEGIRLYLKNGRRIFFSTNDKELFENALRNLISS